MVTATVITALAHSSPVLRCELDRTHGLDWYDSQARFYDSILLRTNSMDKKAGDYTWLSPYLWCAGNPIEFVDPDGMDYGILYDPNNSQLTIKANYYTFRSGAEIVKEAISFWNNQSKSLNGYNIKIDLKLITIEDLDDENEIVLDSQRQNALSQKMANDEIGNSVLFMDYLPQDNAAAETNGSSAASKVIALDSNVNMWTVAHEIGHTLLLRHTKHETLMSPGATYKSKDLHNNSIRFVRSNIIDNTILNQFIVKFKELKK